MGGYQYNEVAAMERTAARDKRLGLEMTAGRLALIHYPSWGGAGGPWFDPQLTPLGFNA